MMMLLVPWYLVGPGTVKLCKDWHCPLHWHWWPGSPRTCVSHDPITKTTAAARWSSVLVLDLLLISNSADGQWPLCKCALWGIVLFKALLVLTCTDLQRTVCTELYWFAPFVLIWRRPPPFKLRPPPSGPECDHHQNHWQHHHLLHYPLSWTLPAHSWEYQECPKKIKASFMKIFTWKKYLR